MGILKLIFFRVGQTKRNWVRRHWVDVTFLCHAHVKNTRLHPKLKLDSNVKRNGFNGRRKKMIPVMLRSIMTLKCSLSVS